MKTILLLLLTLRHAHADGPELSACDKIDPPRDAVAGCTDYEAHPGFKHLPSVVAAKRACLAFYETAWRTNAFFCSVTRHVLDVRSEVARFGATPALAERDRAFYAETRKELARHHGEITKKAQELRLKIARINSEAQATMMAELGCTFNRNRTEPGPVAGPLLLGFAEKAFSEVWLNEPELISALRATNKMMREAEAKSAPDAPPSLAAELLGEPKAPQKKAGAIPIPEPPADDTPDSTHTFWALNSIAQYYAEQYGDEYLSIWAKKLFRRNPQIFKKVPWLAKKFPEYAGTIAAAGLGLGMQYLAHGKVGTLELISVGVTAYSFGAGLFVDLVIAAHRDTQDKLREFGEFAGEQLKKRRYMSSFSLATAWAKEKKTTCWWREDRWASLETEAAEPAKDKAPGESLEEEEDEE